MKKFTLSILLVFVSLIAFSQERCGACSGTGKAQCGYCSGRGKVMGSPIYMGAFICGYNWNQCNNCGGTGKNGVCSRCKGKGTVASNQVNGGGYYPVPNNNYNNNYNNSNTTTSSSSRITDGKIKCSSCGGSGRHGFCNGTGFVNGSTCASCNYGKCPTCYGRGWFY